MSSSSTTGFVTRVSVGVEETRTFNGTAGEIAVTNGDGLPGDPVIGLDGHPAALAGLTASAGKLPWFDSASTMATADFGASARALLADPAAQNVSFLQSGVGAVPRTLLDKGREVVSVLDYGVTGDGTTDDTVNFNKALTAAAGKILWVPDGVYRVAAGSTHTGHSGVITIFTGALIVPSNSHVILSPNAIIECIPTDLPNGSAFWIFEVENVIIEGGQVVGDRAAHTGVGGEGLTGTAIYGGSNILLRDTIYRDWWGDGVNINPNASNLPGQNVQLWRLTCDNNRRNGLSVICVINAYIYGCAFLNNNGTAPEAGVDVEPNPGQVCTNVKFVSCHAEGNAVYGFIAAPQSSTSKLTDVRDLSLIGCHAVNNPTGFLIAADGISSILGPTLIDCEARGSTGNGFHLRNSKHAKLTNCIAAENGGHGFYIVGDFAAFRLMCSASTGTFAYGETVTGGTSGATGTVVSWSGARRQLLLRAVTGTFVAETITGGTSGATATLIAAVPEPASFANSFIGCRAFENVANGFFVEGFSERHSFSSCAGYENANGFRLLSSYNQISACQAMYNTNSGISLGVTGGPASYGSVANCQIYANVGTGLQVAVGEKNLITDNMIRSMAVQGTGIAVQTTNGYNRFVSNDYSAAGRFTNLNSTDATTIFIDNFT